MSRNQKYIKLINSVKWRNTRHTKLIYNPICEICRDKLATEVHLQALCHQCHKNLHLEMKLHKNQKESVKRNNKERTDDFMNRYFE